MEGHSPGEKAPGSMFPLAQFQEHQTPVWHKPLLAVALALTLWPAAVLTTVIGAPLVVADNVLQDRYRSRAVDLPLSGPPVPTHRRSRRSHQRRTRLTAGQRVGFHQYTFPEGVSPTLLIEKVSGS